MKKLPIESIIPNYPELPLNARDTIDRARLITIQRPPKNHPDYPIEMLQKYYKSTIKECLGLGLTPSQIRAVIDIDIIPKDRMDFSTIRGLLDELCNTSH